MGSERWHFTCMTSLNKLIVVAAVISLFFCRLEKVSAEVVRCREKETPTALNYMEFSG